jgi:tRNA (guanine-N7-)-methyltransferase
MAVSDNLPHIQSTIKTYVLRRGRMTETQRKDYEELHLLFCILVSSNVSVSKSLDFESVFGNKNPVVMEIGFGMGGATGEIARANPGINYLGIEVHTPGVARLLGDIRRKGIANIRIIEHDAIEVCARMIAPESLAGIHIFFPDPWQKKRHHKRRIITIERLSVILPCLARGGYVHFITDWEEYAQSALATLKTIPELQNKYEGFAPRQILRPETKFESRGKKEARAIWELVFERTGSRVQGTGLRGSRENQ